MIIGIDAFSYGKEQHCGTEWYSYHILNELIPQFGRDHHNHILLYAFEDFTPSEPLPFNVRKRILPFSNFWAYGKFSLELLQRPVDVFWASLSYFPLFLPKKTVVTVSDVAFRRIPKAFSFWQRYFLHFNAWRAVKSAQCIIVPSKNTKQDLIDLYACPPEKIIVLPYGKKEVPKFSQLSYEKEQKFRKRFKIQQDDVYLFFIGCLEPKKNLLRLVEAFHLLRKKFPEWKLVLAGRQGKDFNKISETVAKMNLQQHVLIPGYVTEEEKDFLLENCRIVALPSLHEGFGSLVVDAFTHSKPVLASKIPALQETALDAAFYVDPLSVEDIHNGLLKLASDPFFAQQLARKGEKHLKKFSWEKTAEETLKILLDVN